MPKIPDMQPYLDVKDIVSGEVYREYYLLRGFENRRLRNRLGEERYANAGVSEVPGMAGDRDPYKYKVRATREVSLEEVAKALI